ncbi:MAG: hypothetical protein F2840_15545 [Actinobacteria bacterium]|nr:hypothetical protein [Actinomycetota bacterium]
MMEHSPDETLALLALGEPVGSTALSQHLTTCSICRSHLDELVHTVNVARSVTTGDSLTSPPADLWNRIAAEVAAATPTPNHPASASTTTQSTGFNRLVRSPWGLAAAAAVGLLAGGIGTAALSAGNAAPDVIASARLDPVGDTGVSGTAALTRTADGQLLSVDVPRLVARDGYFEVWMATRDTSTMVAVGSLGSDQHGEFTVPPGVDISEYPIVDVSFERLDGNPAHSVVSVVRGTLTS